MNFKAQVNIVRRIMMHALTRYIGSGIITNQAIEPDVNNIKKILIIRPNNRLGNQLLITPIVQDVSRIFPYSTIDIFVRGTLSNIIFQNYENVDRIIPLPRKPFKELLKYMAVWFSLRKHKYDIVINVDRVSSSGKLSTKLANGKLKFFNDDDKDLEMQFEDYHHFAKHSIYNLRKILAELGYKFEDAPIPSLDIKLSPEEMEKGKKVLDSLVDKDKKTICIYTFATGDKCFTEDWWKDFYNRLKDAYASSYNILEVLPVENVSQIGFEATSYYSRDIREMCAVIANSEVFVGADCGIMHLASASHTPTVGLFSVTDMSKYRPYGNNSIAIDTNNHPPEEIVTAIGEVLNK